MMTLPRLRYDRIIWVLFLLLVGAILLFAIRARKNSFTRRTEVEVVALEGGSKLINESNVKQMLLRAFGSDLNGTELSRLEIENMEAELEKDPFVLDADVFVDQQEVLRVTVQQRPPIVRILDNNNGNYYLDGQGVRMPHSPNFAARVIVATGNLPNYAPDFREKKNNRLKDLFLLVNTLLKDEELGSFVQQIHVTNTNDFVLIPLIGDQKIILGSIKRLDDKLARLKIFYKKAMPYTGWRKYKSINLRYAGQVVCEDK